ncbi:hypothetical protein BT69DRAFT_1348446 [Atractiella rhizophila]|nr:hypothetical protein BT69DRAFT_1348446 [Atractiella rhizophila]
MASLPPEALAIIQSILGSTPEGGNPFLVASAYFESELYLSLPTGYFVNLYILSWLFAISLIASLVTLFLRFRRRLSFALLRLVHTPRGVLLSPQTAVTFPLFTGLFLAVAQGTVWVTVGVYKHKQSQINFIAWKTFIFVPLYPALICEVWGCFITYILTSAKYTVPTPWLPPPKFINIFFPTNLFLVLLSQFTVLSLANNHFNNAFSAYRDLQHLFVQYAGAYDGNLDPNAVVGVAGPLMSFLKEFDDFQRLFRIGHILWMVYLLLLSLIYLPLAFSYIRMLRHQIRTIKSSYSHPLQTPAKSGLNAAVSGGMVKTHYESMHHHIVSTPRVISPSGIVEREAGVQIQTIHLPPTQTQQQREEDQLGPPPPTGTGKSGFGFGFFGGTGGSRKIGSADTGGSEKRRVVESYNSLIASCAAIVLALTLYVAQTLWITVDVQSVIRHKGPLQVNDVGSLYVYAILGGAAHVLILIRSLRSPASTRSTTANTNTRRGTRTRGNAESNGDVLSRSFLAPTAEHFNQHISLPGRGLAQDEDGRPLTPTRSHTQSYVQRFEASALFGPRELGPMVTFATPIRPDFSLAETGYHTYKEKEDGFFTS